MKAANTVKASANRGLRRVTTIRLTDANAKHLHNLKISHPGTRQSWIINRALTIGLGSVYK